MADWRIKLVNDQWGWSYGNESSGLSLWGYTSKADAGQAVDTYRRIEAVGLDVGGYIVQPPKLP